MKVKHQTFIDERGSFTPISTNFYSKEWNQFNVVTNNDSYIFRGMHYQTNPPQTKCIKVVKGEIIDFWYDLESNKVREFHLTSNDFLIVPNTQAHGYLTLTSDTVVVYMVQGEYSPQSEKSIPWHSIKEIKTSISQYFDSPPEENIITSQKDS